MGFWSKIFPRSQEGQRCFGNDEILQLTRFAFAELEKLDLTAFPLIEDFTIQLKDTHSRSFGLHLSFYSELYGTLTNFPWWDHVDKDLRSQSYAGIFPGSVDGPYHDFEQSWEILIFEDDAFVYIMEGDFREIDCSEFQSWFRVPKEQYYSEWEKICRQFKPAA